MTKIQSQKSVPADTFEHPPRWMAAKRKCVTLYRKDGVVPTFVYAKLRLGTTPLFPFHLRKLFLSVTTLFYLGFSMPGVSDTMTQDNEVQDSRILRTSRWIGWLARNGNFHKHDGLILDSALGQGIDPHLWKAVVMVESRGNERARSRVGAIGLSQLMPRTARILGLTANNRYEPEANLKAGAKYLSFLLERFNNDLELALAAYNAGPNKVLEHRGIPDFGETQRFVISVLTLYRWLQTSPSTWAKYDPTLLAIDQRG